MEFEMEYKINESITILEKYSFPYANFPMENDMCSHVVNWYYDLYIKICLRGRWFDVIPTGKAYRIKNSDGYYRFIYIQINEKTGEYYIGKVNRQRLSELKNYQGSGVKFKPKYKKHSEDFKRYYIARCYSAKETEQLEAEIVDKELLKDPFCLNRVSGGGGTNKHYDYDRREKQREYMKNHPEAYEALLRYVREHPLDQEEISRRNEKRRKTMSKDKYKQMTRDRINNWKNNHPEEYEKARKKNLASIRTDDSRKKKSDLIKAWRESHPEELQKNEKKRIQALHSPEVKAKQSRALKKWNSEHSEEVKLRVYKSAIKNRKPLNMLDLQSGKILKTFVSLNEAAEWLVENGYAKNTNCKSSISAVCLHKPCTTGYGYRNEAYGFRWEYVMKTT